MSTLTTTSASTAQLDTWTASSVALYAGRIEEFLAHWTADGSYRVAYPIEGIPATVSGHDELRALFTSLTAYATSIGVEDVRLHPTVDPDVMFVEERMVAHLTDGATYDNRLVLRVTFREGLIAEILEYYGEVAHRALIARVVAMASTGTR